MRLRTGWPHEDFLDRGAGGQGDREPDALRDAAVWMKGFGQMESIDLDAFERFLAAELDE